jgi:hypothetical protein
MSNEHAQKVILDLLVSHEKILADIYLLYATRYDEYKEYWMQMHQEELGHVDLLRSMEQRVAEGYVSFNEERMKLGTVQAVVQYARSMLTYVKRQFPSLSAAVGIALDLEDSMVEKGIFEVFVTDSAETKEAFTKMAATFTEHFANLKKFQKLVDPKKRAESAANKELE